jgi:hypothetical protein
MRASAYHEKGGFGRDVHAKEAAAYADERVRDVYASRSASCTPSLRADTRGESLDASGKRLKICEARNLERVSAVTANSGQEERGGLPSEERKGQADVVGGGVQPGREASIVNAMPIGNLGLVVPAELDEVRAANCQCIDIPLRMGDERPEDAASP